MMDSNNEYLKFLNENQRRFLPEDRLWWSKYVYHYTNIDNAISILMLKIMFDCILDLKHLHNIEMKDIEQRSSDTKTQMLQCQYFLLLDPMRFSIFQVLNFQINH